MERSVTNQERIAQELLALNDALYTFRIAVVKYTQDFGNLAAFQPEACEVVVGAPGMPGSLQRLAEKLATMQGGTQ
jgi:hypothetical protein